MATKDNIVNLEDLKVSHDDLDGKVSDLKSDISALYDVSESSTITGWEQGYIRPNGTFGAASDVCRKRFTSLLGSAHVVFTAKSGYLLNVFEYSSNNVDNFVSVINSECSSTVSFRTTEGYYYCFAVKKEDGTALALADLPEDVVTYYYMVVPEEDVLQSENLLDMSTVTANSYINVAGRQLTSQTLNCTDYIPVSPGDVIVGTFYSDPTPVNIRFVCAYSHDKTVLSSAGAENVTAYTVPDGVAYIRVSFTNHWMASRVSRIYGSGTVLKYQPYYRGSLVDGTTELYTETSDIKRYPLTTLPQYILNNLSYKPLGALSKGYICLVSDDGNAELETYTIPMVEAKNVPATWSVMKDSEVFATQSGIDAVVDSVNNHGCQIAQHGNINWDTYGEYELNAYFDDQISYFESIGLVPYGAVCPSHHINSLISCVAGGRFGCCRTGFQYGAPYYDNYMNGARSNLYGLSCYGVTDGTLQAQKDHLDYAKNNNLLCVVFWHDNQMSDTNNQQRLEDVIDYAKQIGLTFITMKDIPTIT